MRDTMPTTVVSGFKLHFENISCFYRVRCRMLLSFGHLDLCDYTNFNAFSRPFQPYALPDLCLDWSNLVWTALDPARASHTCDLSLSLSLRYCRERVKCSCPRLLCTAQRQGPLQSASPPFYVLRSIDESDIAHASTLVSSWPALWPSIT